MAFSFPCRRWRQRIADSSEGFTRQLLDFDLAAVAGWHVDGGVLLEVLLLVDAGGSLQLILVGLSSMDLAEY